MISDGRRSNPTKDSQSKQLLKMFQSESFTPDQVIKYFISTFDEPGPHQFLTNKILSMSNKFVEYYIPQFWYPVYLYVYVVTCRLRTTPSPWTAFWRSCANEASPTISRYFITKTLQIMWCLHAYADTERHTTRFEKTERVIISTSSLAT